MTDDLERLNVVARCDTDSTMRHFAYAVMEQDPDGDYVTYAAAKARITDLESRLAAAEAGEDALAKTLDFTLKVAIQFEKQASKGVSGRRGGMAFEKARAALAAYEARRKG